LDVGLDIRQVPLSNLDVLISDWDTGAMGAQPLCGKSQGFYVEYRFNGRLGIDLIDLGNV